MVVNEFSNWFVSQSDLSGISQLTYPTLSKEIKVNTSLMKVRLNSYMFKVGSKSSFTHQTAPE